MDSIDSKEYQIMSKDRVVGEYRNGEYRSVDPEREPLFPKNTRDFREWLADRCLDVTRKHSRLVIRIAEATSLAPEDIALKVRAAKITDSYWVREKGSDAAHIDAKFTRDDLARAALHGDTDCFKYRKSHSPELTNTGSLEKCWMLYGDEWHLLKQETDREAFSEIFTSAFARSLGYNAVQYSYNAEECAVECTDFTNAGEICLEEANGFIRDYADFEENYRFFRSLGEDMAEEYKKILFVDALCMNVDRHDHNYGILRDPETGNIIGMAPNYDNNLSLYTNPACDRGIFNEAFLKDYVAFFAAHPLKDQPALNDVLCAADQAYTVAAEHIPEEQRAFAHRDCVLSFIESGALAIGLERERSVQQTVERDETPER